MKKEVKKSDDNIDDEKLDKIGEEIDKNKKDSKSLETRKNKHKNIIRNVFIGIFAVIYMGILLLGKYKVSTIGYINALKIITVIDLIGSIVLFEIAFSKDSFNIGIHGIEMAFLGGFTVFILELFSRQDSKFEIYFSVMVGIILLYYIVKTIVIALKKKK